MQLEHRLWSLIQLHLYTRLNSKLHWIEQRELQDETRNIYILGFGATYVRDVKACIVITQVGFQKGEHEQLESETFLTEFRKFVPYGMHS